MAYTKTTWATGDTITADKLNHAEQGIYDANAGALIIATYSLETYTTSLNKKYGEIVAMFESGICPVIKYSEDGEDSYYPVIKVGYSASDEKYRVMDGDEASYFATDEDDYPETAGLG